MAIYDYRWATGHDVVLGSLTNIETDLTSYALNRDLGISSLPVNLFPIRRQTADSVEVGYGSIPHVWTITALSRAGMAYIISTYCNSNGTGKAITIYTRLHVEDSYARYNAHLAYPVPGQDFTYRQGKIVDISLRFSNLEAL